MDAKDVKAHVGNLERAVKEKLPTQTLLDILGSLKKEVVATEQLLRVCTNPSSVRLPQTQESELGPERVIRRGRGGKKKSGREGCLRC